MSRVDELQKKYSGIPRHIILKLDGQVQGINNGGDLDKLSTWTRAFSKGSYHSKSADGSLRELAEESPSRVRPGEILRPPREMRFSSGQAAEIRPSSASPYYIREVSEGKFALYENDSRVEDVFFPQLAWQPTSEPVTSKGRPISTLMDLRRCCFYLNVTRYCQYFSTGDECKFCNLNQSQRDARFAGLDVPITLDPDEVAEAFRMRNSEVRQVEGFLTMGGMAKPGQAVRVMLKYVERLATAAPNKPNFTTNAHLPTRRELRRLKDAGLNCISIQIEVMHPALFAEVCPGKAKHAPYERWIESLHDAVDILGVGNVSCTPMVAGITLMVPNGHKTWQEALDHHIEVNNYLIANGILPVFIPLWWAEGSVVSRDESNKQKFVPTEYYLEMALAHHGAMLEHGLYGKLNRLMICGMHCSVAYGGDIGMLTIAGHVGKWMSPVVPEESNWLSKFAESVKFPGKSQ